MKKKPIPISQDRKMLSDNDKKEQEPFKRHQVLKILSENKDNKTLLLTTTGYTGRELFSINDSPQNLYMIGSMGCVDAIGLGLALAQTDKRVVVIDGDGALLMRAGTLATTALYHPENFLHILLDNGEHESTGGQATASKNINFKELAESMGYDISLNIHSLEKLINQYKQWLQKPQLTFFHVEIEPGTLENLGRPNLKPNRVKARLMQYIEDN